MVEINPLALVYLVQLVDEKLHYLKQQVDSREPDNEELLGFEEELMTCSKVAMELERCYLQATKEAGNIPPYSELVQRPT